LEGEARLTEPLVPADIDLRGYEFIPLFGDRLFGSETWIGITADAKLAALQLWWRAYAKEVPASSLPNNDALLSNYAGYGTQTNAWRKVKPQAMRGFVLCTDERWYHPFVAELALEAWKGRKQHQLRTLKARIAALQKRRAAATTDDDRKHLDGLLHDLQQALNEALSKSVTDLSNRVSNTVPQERERRGTGTGRGQDKENLESNPLSGKPDDAPPDEPKKLNGAAYYPEAEDVLGYLNRLTGKGFQFRTPIGELTSSGDMIVQRLKQGYTREDLREVVHAKCEQWLHSDDMHQYLRPETLFGKKKFEQYIGELRGTTNG
jgi:uncharacterized phage protein (TIGR02220 family)